MQIIAVMLPSCSLFLPLLIFYCVKIVRLKVYMTITSPMTSTFIQGHKWVGKGKNSVLNYFDK